MPTSNTCYQIRAGRTRTTAIPAAGLPLPVSRQPEYRAPIAFAGDEHPDWISHTLPQVTEIATRRRRGDMVLRAVYPNTGRLAR